MGRQIGTIRYRLRFFFADETFNDVHYTNQDAASKAFNLAIMSNTGATRIEMDKITSETIRIWEPGKK